MLVKIHATVVNVSRQAAYDQAIFRIREQSVVCSIDLLLQTEIFSHHALPSQHQSVSHSKH